ncbi:PREDICTED: LOB domain-containing protein 10-like [Tarenaya hassleriana]|uniref:LOB domain-containing protein 10-like n=1 Tax=Tarenaya hassleriana TaxID=28532 RepID=UPI00053C66D6|nr:PREDICTED: LOB domain-containing protein 10-like [Tarenaya hassleriana]XP_010531220.1 PREDICTED: LOB domain-containing protein 10-like [Tarenaya hassleriana]XP_010531221.1 PREDICTED: LOB domain-containing protein 10-like [Tarenaya hassleriana]XP_010531222.1 PREDICTED: LOB domain-containing protein 10-like [Tarenaya hassleriana]XP_010531223.1 PREDICTED: LOB domain-containing protein 10-like [Tarenaya hassleriana]XP_010531224.1 PREDICTED: LOB domain-containing protein 10-like [Tarenaya hassle
MASTPCAACKLLRRKCTQECVFAPYFPPSQPQKFAFVHRVFGASNMAKILNEIPNHQREDAVNSLYYEAEARLRDPIYGCVGLISFLQQYLKKVQHDLVASKNELATYVGIEAVLPYLPPPGNPPPNFMATPSPLPLPMEGMPAVMPQGQALAMREPNLPQEQQQFTASDAQRMAAMLLDRGDHGIFGGGFGIENSGSVTATGFNQMDINQVGGSSSAGPSLALGSFGDTYQINQEAEQGHELNPDQLQTQLMLQPPEPQEEPEGQFLMAEGEPEQMQEPQMGGGGRLGSEEASN